MSIDNKLYEIWGCKSSEEYHARFAREDEAISARKKHVQDALGFDISDPIEMEKWITVNSPRWKANDLEEKRLEEERELNKAKQEELNKEKLKTLREFALHPDNIERWLVKRVGVPPKLAHVCKDGYSSWKNYECGNVKKIHEQCLEDTSYWFYGKSGRGKTHFAVVKAIEVFRKDETLHFDDVKFLDWVVVWDEYKKTTEKGKPDKSILRPFYDARVLILDEPLENVKKAQISELRLILGHLESRGARVYVTTNPNPEQFAKLEEACMRDDGEVSKVTSRLMGMCKTIEIRGDDQRWTTIPVMGSDQRGRK